MTSARVTATRVTATARPPLRQEPRRDLDEQTDVGEVYMRSLLRVQRRLAITVLGVVGAALAVVPLFFVLAPGLSTYRVFGMPLPWLVLGVAVHPLLFAAGGWHVRRAERVEADFTDLLSGR